MKKSDIKIGQRVTCKEEVPAYYSGLGPNTVCIFRPGMVGIVRLVNVPSVHRENVSFVCVDFQGPVHNNPPTTEWRCALLYDNIKKVKDK